MKKTKPLAIILSLIFIITHAIPAYAAAPIITLDATTANVNEGAWVIIGAGATVTDAEGIWSTGSLNVQVSVNAQINDDLDFRTNGNFSRNTAVIPEEILFSGTVIGTTTGWRTNSLTITFNANATTPIVEELVQSIRFRPNDNNPTTPKTITFTLTDGDGEIGVASRQVTVNTINDAPTISGWGAPDPIYTENDPPIQLDNNTTFADIDGGTLDGSTLTLSIIADCVTSEDVLGIGNYGNITTSGSDVLYSGIDIGDFTGGPDFCANPLVVTFNDNAAAPLTITLAHLDAVANAFTYENLSDDPTLNTITPTQDRQLRLRVVQLGNGRNQNGKYIDIVSVIDAPIITLDSAPASATEQIWNFLDTSATVTDADSVDFDTGTLTVQITNPFTGDRLAFNDEGSGAGQIGRVSTPSGPFASSGSVSYGGTIFGTFTWTAGTYTLSFTLNSNATPAAVQALVRNIQYNPNSNNPNTTQRSIDFQLRDGDGGTSTTVTKLVNIVPVNDDPVISDFSPDITYTENSPAIQLDDDVSIVDYEYTNYDSGTLTVDFSMGSTTADQLAIGNIGTVSTSGSDVIVNGFVIGTFSGGTNGTALVVNFNNIAINARITPLLQALTYANTSENPAATRTVRIVATDGDGGTSAAVTKVINATAVNDEPYFDMGGNQTVQEDAGAQTVANWATNIDDGDGGSQALTFTVSNNNNALFSTQPAIAANGTLTYTPAANANGVATVTVESLKDDGGTANGGDDTFVPITNTFTITVTPVNDEPSFTSGGNVSVAEDSGAYNTGWATNIDDGDPETTQTLTFTVTNNNNPLFSTQPDLDEATGNLTFTPAANTTGSATVTVYLADNGGTANSGDDDTYGPITFTITVTNQNDPPTDITLSNNSVAENQSAGTLVGTLTTTDIDTGDSHTYTLVTGVVGCDSSGNASFQIGGASNDELQTGAVFDYETPPTSFNICIQTEDSAGAKYTEQFSISVTNVNDAPVNSVPGPQTTGDGTPLEFSTAQSNLIFVSDEDAGTADLEISLSVANGTLTLSGVSGLFFSTGTGTNNASMVFTGALSDINTALDGMVYTPNSGYTGPETLTITSNDQGNTGSGGAQTDTDNVTITVGNVPPTVITNGVDSNPSTPDGVLSQGEVLPDLKQIIFTFTEAMDNSTSGDEVTNIANYLLLYSGSDNTFQTGDCNAVKNGAGVDPADKQIPITSVTYNSSTYTATLNFNSSLSNGLYRVYACGTATLRDLAGNALAGDGTNPGTDFTLDFTIQVATDNPEINTKNLPATGFAPGRTTPLPAQPAQKLYAATDLTLEIPALNVTMSIIGIPQTDNSWDVTWLGKNAGWLNGSAYPTWSGNTVLTGHVWDAYNQPGPFAQLKTLKYGDQFYIHAFGQTYTYEVRENNLYWAKGNSQKVFQHEELDWVTLLTCETYNPVNGDYFFRRAVRAVLVSVK